MKQNYDYLKPLCLHQYELVRQYLLREGNIKNIKDIGGNQETMKLIYPSKQAQYSITMDIFAFCKII